MVDANVFPQNTRSGTCRRGHRGRTFRKCGRTRIPGDHPKSLDRMCYAGNSFIVVGKFENGPTHRSGDLASMAEGCCGCRRGQRRVRCTVSFLVVRSHRYRHWYSSQAEASPVSIRPFLQTWSTWPLSTTRSAADLRKFEGSCPPQVESNVVHQKSDPRAECDDCEKQLFLCQWRAEYCGGRVGISIGNVQIS